MKIYNPPRTNLQASNVILGMMRISDMDDEEIRALVGTARDAGINFFDHADIYGGAHGCEKRFGDAVTFTDAEREAVIIQSKVGIRQGFFDFSKEHILRSVDESLAALNIDYLDILLLHRPDTLVEPEDVAAAFDALHAAGKVRNFGVSNQTPGVIELLKRSVNQPLAFNQVQLSITHAPLIAQGVAANMAGLDQSIDRDNGLLEYSRLNDITLQAWSPFQSGIFDGVFVGDRENYGPLNDALDDIAAAHGVTPTGIAVAWITRHPANIQVVLGTTKPARVVESAAGSEIPLSREEWYRLFTTAGHVLP
ncbi:aldo/keto reductase family oxidoreductase [Cryobacterium sp. TMT1-62]|uniref:Aldo/keto reductase family oxidoreductase n=1 Tax=Cryobacterium sandaracinum TaxID=1259247 RepID=A0ABY2JDV4_9MICO|nr:MULTISPECIES: aldo/keto reductase [Cryobacterium]TFB65529.1 aldo/keto reductase family oxidoreductase [Cryobacterium sp. Hz7]TFC32947.1 aldo/keto reductase family oxidoreductase [Cryobacterium sp. TMT2-14]TFC53272.1 aldo/keto reductase family oxidoreductase [Cryobacterium sp. TMT2-17-1]TFC69016.1 aldo/keto reductase family oxidoreductase [Cryobacterium sp. TMT2-4]TFD03176.1 aldo/keto reductase family oxidoreductase [Cryobacterium sandaracinum]